MSYLAESYERFMVPALFGPWASQLIKIANPQAGEWVLDLACGTGIVARKIIPRLERDGRIVGWDLEHTMLSVAQSVIGQEIPESGWCQGRAEELGFAESSFDLVVCQFGLMLFANRETALSEIRRVLRKGGRVVLSVWQGLERHPFYQTLHNVSLRRLGTSGVQSAFSLGDATELRKMLEETGFLNVEVEPATITGRFPNPEEFLAWEISVDPATVPSLRDLDPPEQQAILASVRADMEAPLQETMHEDEVVIPFHALIARASR